MKHFPLHFGSLASFGPDQFGYGPMSEYDWLLLAALAISILMRSRAGLQPFYQG
jgi:hypothetical protein